MTHRLIPRRRFLAGAGAVAISGSPGRHAANAQATFLRLPASPLHPPASIILNNGKVVTLDRNSTIAQALAVAGNRIIAVGPNDTMAQHIGPETRVIDLKGQTVVPGLIDGHAHMDREALRNVFPSLVESE